MKFKADLLLSVWLRDIEVEGKDENDAEDNLYKMTVEQLLEKGYVSEEDITDIDLVVTEKDLKVEAYNIKYDLSDADGVGYNPAEELPTEFSVTVTVEGEDEEDIEEAILDELEYQIGADYPIESFDYKIVEEN